MVIFFGLELLPLLVKCKYSLVLITVRTRISNVEWISTIGHVMCNLNPFLNPGHVMCAISETFLAFVTWYVLKLFWHTSRGHVPFWKLFSNTFSHWNAFSLPSQSFRPIRAILVICTFCLPKILQNIPKMSATISRQQILTWINESFGLEYYEARNLSSGLVYIQLLDWDKWNSFKDRNKIPPSTSLLDRWCIANRAWWWGIKWV